MHGKICRILVAVLVRLHAIGIARLRDRRISVLMLGAWSRSNASAVGKSNSALRSVAVLAEQRWRLAV
jgi:hypothetical protein